MTSFIVIGRNEGWKLSLCFKGIQQTIGDDWPLFVKKRDAGEVFNYLKGLAGKMKNGDVAGIGFHPWVLFSDLEILEGFKMFLDYLHRNREFNIQPAHDYAIEHG